MSEQELDELRRARRRRADEQRAHVVRVGRVHVAAVAQPAVDHAHVAEVRLVQHARKLAAAVGGGGRHAGGGREVAVEEGSDVREQVALEPAGRGDARSAV